MRAVQSARGINIRRSFRGTPFVAQRRALPSPVLSIVLHPAAATGAQAFWRLHTSIRVFQ
jgi:hypothetical protein